MDKHKGRGGRNKPASIDGIVQTGRTIGFSKTTSYQPGSFSKTPSLDNNFNRQMDGFYPSREAMPAQSLDPSEEHEAAQLLDEPIVLDHIEERKRKQRFWQRHAKFKKRLKRTAMTFIILVLAGGGYFGYKLYHTQRKVLAGGGKAVSVCTDNVDTELLSREGDSRINILLLGIGGPGHDGGDLTDTVMLASVDPINDKVQLISIPRDFWVRIPGDGYQKLNAAYTYGKERSRSKTKVGIQQDGLALLDRTLQPILDGVHINYHVLLDFSAFKQMVDAVGGITVNVPETLYDPTVAWENHNSSIVARKGIQHFNGQQALLYSRSRETTSDFARAERQRLIITSLKQKVFSAGTFSNPVRISSLLDSLGDNVYTDFSSTDMRCLYRQMSTIPPSSILSLDMVTPPHNLLTTGNVNGLSIVQPRAGLFDYDDIHTFLHSNLKDGLITKESASVTVYNATSTSGLATNVSSLLKSYGYKVTTTANAPNQTNPATTKIVDLSDGKAKYTRHYLESRLGVTATEKLPEDYGITPPEGTKFVIILGEDATSNTTE